MIAVQPDTAAAAPSYRAPLNVGGYHVTFAYETPEYKCFRVEEGDALVGYLRIVWTGREVFTPHDRFRERRDEIHDAVGEAVASRCFA